MNKKEKILAIIPARGGSKGLPKKNIRLLGCKPLIYYPIRLAREMQKRGLISGHIVSTDSREIASVAKRYGGNVPYLRPKNLATDKSLVVDTIIYTTAAQWEKENSCKVHSVLLLQPTHPLTPVKDLEKAIRHYLNNQPKTKCLVSIAEAQNFRPSTLYYKKGKYLEQVLKGVNPTTRRQNLRITYWRNGGIYITRRDLIFGERKVIDESPLYYEMSRFCSVDIDDIFDLAFANFLLKYSKHNGKNGEIKSTEK